MILTFWTIYALLILCSYGLSFGKQSYSCRRVLLRYPRVSLDVSINIDLICSVARSTGEAGPFYAKARCILSALDSTEQYGYLADGHCQINQMNYLEMELQCVSQNGGELNPKNSVGKSDKDVEKLKRNQVQDIVYFINSSKHVRNLNITNTKNARNAVWRTKEKSRVLICTKLNKRAARKKSDVRFRRKGTEFGRVLERKKRDILGHYNSSTTYSPYLKSSTIWYQATSPTAIWCPRSVVVNRSTILVTPTLPVTKHFARFVATSQLTPLTHFTTTTKTVVLHNHTSIANISNLSAGCGRRSAVTATLNSSMVTHFETTRVSNATYIHNKGLVSVIFTKQASALVTTMGCATVANIKTTTQNVVPTFNVTSTQDNTANTKLYFGLIIGGGVLLSLLIFTAFFLLVRRYRRMQSLRRKAKQISYFNRFDCSSAWDQPDKFGGSKLSVFTLKNSKFDIDWESTHDTKE